jgi:ABC-2 type transport system permease protein
MGTEEAAMTARTATAVPAPRRGLEHLWASYRSMVRFEIVNLRLFLVLTLVIQTLMGAGMGILYGFYLGDLPPLGQTFLVSGIPALSLFPLGFVLVPAVIADHRFEETYDYMWSLPVPRVASALATFTVFAGLSLPGMLLALVLSVLAYGVTLTPSLMIVPAVLISAAMATSVGYALGHAVKNPRVVNILTNFIVFLVLMFSPIVVPIQQFPGWFAAVHHVLPFWHMANVLRAGLTTGLVEHVATSYAVLAAWLIGAWIVAARVISRRG